MVMSAAAPLCSAFAATSRRRLRGPDRLLIVLVPFSRAAVSLGRRFLSNCVCHWQDREEEGKYGRTGEDTELEEGEIFESGCGSGSGFGDDELKSLSHQDPCTVLTDHFYRQIVKPRLIYWEDHLHHLV